MPITLCRWGLTVIGQLWKDLVGPAYSQGGQGRSPGAGTTSWKGVALGVLSMGALAAGA